MPCTTYIHAYIHTYTHAYTCNLSTVMCLTQRNLAIIAWSCGAQELLTSMFWSFWTLVDQPVQWLPHPQYLSTGSHPIQDYISESRTQESIVSYYYSTPIYHRLRDFCNFVKKLGSVKIFAVHLLHKIWLTVTVQTSTWSIPSYYIPYSG